MQDLLGALGRLGSADVASLGIGTLAATRGGPQADREACAGLCAKCPTAVLAVIEFDVDEWRGLGETGGRLSVFVTPQDMN